MSEASVIDLLKRSMNQRLAFALAVLAVTAVLTHSGSVDSSGFVTLMLGVVAAYYAEQVFTKRGGQQG